MNPLQPIHVEPVTHSSSAPTLRVQQLHIAHGDWTLCRAWSHQWAPGLHLLQGGDGAGKTTLLRVLGGVLAARSGQVQGVSQPGGSAADYGVFWVDPRQPDVLGSATPTEWVAHLVQRYPRWSDAHWRQHVVGWALEGMLHKPWEALSTGTARKVWMAAALASGAELVLIDEPIAGLDRPSLRYLQQALTAYGSTTSNNISRPISRWVMVAHYDDLALTAWDSVLELEALPR